MAPVGAIFGGFLPGWMSDLYGRKMTVLLGGVPFLGGYIMITVAHLFASAVTFKIILLLGRFLTGVGIGWSSLVTPVRNINFNGV